MSPPPDRTHADPKPDVATESRSRDAAPSEPANELGAAHAAIVATQQGAGNRAVASALGGAPRGVQRAPKDDDDDGGGSGATSYAAPSLAPPPRSGATGGTGGTGGAGGGTGATSYAAPSVAPPGSGPSMGAPAPAPPTTSGSDASKPATSPLPVPAGMFGGVNPLEKRQQLVAPREVHMQSEVDVAYQIKPQTVIRSPNENWHYNAWYHSNNGKVADDAPAPQMFKVGGQYYVAPDYKGGATELPVIAAIGGAGTTAPAPGGGASGAPGGPGAPGSNERPMARMPPERPENRLRQAVSPETPPSGPRGNVTAYRVSYQEVEAAFAKDPKSVMRSPKDVWHGQAYRLDGGQGGTPGAFKVGDKYLISPGYPLDNVPYLSVPGVGGAPGAPTGGPAAPKAGMPQAGQTVAPGGTTYAESSPLKAYSATTTEAGGRTQTQIRSREQAVVTTSTETSDGAITNKQEKVRGGGFGVGGNLIGATAGTTDTSKIEGDVVVAKKSKQVNAGLGTDMKLGAEYKSSKEIVTGTDPDGNPIKQSTQTKVGGKIDAEGNINLAAGRDSTNAKGTTKGFGGGAKIDPKGNVELEAYLSIQSKGGLSFKPTVSRGVKVEASDPIQTPNGWEVTYRIADSTSAGVGVGKTTGGGASVGLSGGVTSADFQGGKRSFKTEDEAKKFRDNAAERVATEQLTGKAQAPTSVAGALQIPVGETRSTGDILGSNVGASAGYSGVAVNVGKSESTTNEMAVKRTGPTIVEVTGSVAGSKTGSVGISAPALGHGYSSTNAESFAVTYEFDLSKEQGRAAFELYVRTGWPPGQSPKVIEKGGSQADNETFSIAGLGTVVWTGTTWTVQRETAGGVQSVHGGAQIHEQKPGRVGKFLGEDTLKSNAQIVRVDQDGEEVLSRAQFNVSGTSGEYNRKEFGKIFMGARTDKDVKPSGEWTLSANIPKENIQNLHKVSRKIRNAIDERQAYSELVKEGGAQMLSGQVGGGGSQAWDLELKGDSNFPGEKERVRLKELRKSLMSRIRTNPEIATDILRESNQELAKLEKRREAVADTKKYTDLPDQLRQQQLGVIDMHIDDMKVVRRTAQSVAMKRNPGEKTSDVAARVEQEEKKAPGAKAKKGAPGAAKQAAGDDEAAKLDREYTRLQDQVAAKESQIAAKRNEIRSSSKALGDAIGARGTTAVRFGADTATVQVAIASGKGYIGAATDADKKQSALEPQIEAARNAWSAATDKQGQLAATRTLEKVLDERLKLMHSCIYFITEAGKAVFHITTKSAKSGNPTFWNSLGETEGEE